MTDYPHKTQTRWQALKKAIQFIAPYQRQVAGFILYGGDYLVDRTGNPLALTIQSKNLSLPADLGRFSDEISSNEY